jgi:uroporphyrinogen-III decarboxylase
MVIEPYQMLGEIKEDLADVLGVDVVGLRHPRTMFGFRNDGGYVFNTIHNVQPLTPIENLLAMYETVRDCGRYPLN